VKKSNIPQYIQSNWYVDDQFSQQLGDNTAPQKEVILERWKIFDLELRKYLSTRTFSAPLRVLDAGCGDGINLVGLEKILSNLNQNFKLHAVDLSVLRVGRVLQRFKRINAFVTSLDSLPFQDAYFDIVLCNHVLEHLEQPDIALQELLRVMRPGGMIIIGVPNEGCFMAKMRNYIFQRSILKTTDHINFFTSKSLQNMMTRANLKPLIIYHRGWFLPHMRLIRLFNNIVGRYLLNWIRIVFPSNAADLIAVAIRDP